MFKKRWVYALILTGILVVGVSGGVIFAQSDGEDEESPVQTFTARVATVLGIEEEALEDAIGQGSLRAWVAASWTSVYQFRPRTK